MGAAAAEMAGVEITKTALGGRTTRALNCLMKIPTWLRWLTGMSPFRPLPWTAVSMNLDIWMKDLQKVRYFFFLIFGFFDLICLVVKDKFKLPIDFVY